MIVMALDHIRDFFHIDAMFFSPTDLARTYPALFFTRWITHFCAPVFVFTAGMGAFLLLRRNRTNGQLARDAFTRTSRFLWTRGVWLILLELTVMRLAYNFNFSFRFPILLLILWVIGASMIVLAALIHLPLRVLATLSVIIVVLHNCFDGINAAQFGAAAGLWNIIHQPGAFSIMRVVFIVGYPLVPWVAVMSAGFCFAQVFKREPVSRRRILLRTGLTLTIAFIAIRAANVYGDPVPWSPQKSGVFTLLSFLNCTKYPPSLSFLLMTLGPALLALAWFDRIRFRATNPLIVFGRVPLFYFVLHFYAVHVLADVMAWFRYGRASFPFLFQPIPSMGGPRNLFPPNFGYPLWVVYLVWFAIVVSLYPLCRWFAGIKARRRDWWLSYV